jgi:hypothetical protein
MQKGKRGGQLHQNGHNPNTGARTTTVSSKHCHDRQPPTPTMTYHAPVAPPQPPPSATASTTTTTKASGETSYPAEGVVDDAVLLSSRKPLPRLAASHNTSKVVSPRWPRARRTAAMEAADFPAQRARSPSKKTPAPDTATRQRAEVAAALRRHSSTRGSARSAL